MVKSDAHDAHDAQNLFEKQWVVYMAFQNQESGKYFDQ
jgi:hypothetical protein